MRVLLVDDDEIGLEILANTVECAGCETQVAGDGESGLELFHEFNPQVVISDIEMPGMSGLDLLHAIRGDDADTIVVMATAFDKPEYVGEALRSRANNYLRKPIDPKELLFLLAKYEAITRDREFERIVLGSVVRRELTIRFGNDVELIAKFVNQLVAETGQAFTKAERMIIGLGLDELIRNAVEHGNLAISYDDKSQALSRGEGGMAELMRRRLSDPCYSARRVTVDFRMDEHACEWVIADEGEGFEWREVPDPCSEENLLGMHGRGIFLSRHYFDELEYYGCGNTVRVKKNLIEVQAAQADRQSVGSSAA